MANTIHLLVFIAGLNKNRIAIKNTNDATRLLATLSKNKLKVI